MKAIIDDARVFRRSTFVVLLVSALTFQHCREIEENIEPPSSRARWSSVTPISGSVPSPRSNASAVYDSISNTMIVFGGRNPTDSFGDVWSFDFNTYAWTDVTPPGSSPAARFSHTAILDPSTRRMYIWSGQGQGQALYNDTWVFDLGTGQWQNITPSGTNPAARYGSAAIYNPIDGSMVVFGGFNLQMRFDDTWKFTLVSQAWTDVTPPGMRPGARCLHSAAYDSRGYRFVIYGGQTSGPLDDVWAFNLASNTWEELTPVIRPAGRLFSSMTPTGDGNMVVFGGFTDQGEVNEVWTFDTSQRTWSRVTFSSSEPSQRYGHTAVYIPQKDWLVIFGGSDANQEFNDVWLLENISSP